MVALSSIGSVNADARALVGTASVVGPLAAVGASVLLHRSADRWAGALLTLSAILTPTYMAYALNLAPLVGGLVLLTTPRSVLPPRFRTA